MEGPDLGQGKNLGEGCKHVCVCVGGGDVCEMYVVMVRSVCVCVCVCVWCVCVGMYVCVLGCLLGVCVGVCGGCVLVCVCWWCVCVYGVRMCGVCTCVGCVCVVSVCLCWDVCVCVCVCVVGGQQGSCGPGRRAGRSHLVLPAAPGLQAEPGSAPACHSGRLLSLAVGRVCKCPSPL